MPTTVTIIPTDDREPRSTRIERINVDVTETVMKREWTGIGRVIRRLTTEFSALAEEEGPEVRLVAAIGGRFHALNALGLEQLKVRSAATAGADNGRLARLASALLGFSPPIYAFVQSRFKQRRFRAVLEPLLCAGPAQFGPGDVVLLLDTYWGGMSSIAAARRARRNGAAVVSAIYDLIPITHPHYMTKLVSLAFPHQLLKAMRVSDGALAISQQSAIELRRFLGGRHPALPIRWFHLGNDAAKVSGPRLPTLAAFRYTMVGTIEPRKGHDLVIDAFETLWATGSTSMLTIVGKMGWASPDMQQRLDRHAEMGKRLVVRHDVSDAELVDILHRTDAVIQASEVEGFGLPIVEALANDIPVIASDIPIFREIGSDAILYFAPRDRASLASAITRFEAEPERYREMAERFQWPDWRQSASEVLHAIEDIVPPRRRDDQRG